MLLLIFSSVWVIIGVVAGVIAYASRTGPDDAIKNMSPVAQTSRLDNTQEWISRTVEETEVASNWRFTVVLVVVWEFSRLV